MFKMPSFRKENRDEELQAVIVTYEDLYSEIAQDVETLATLKAEIVALVKERGESFSHINVTATLKNGYTRTSWDTGGLNGYAVVNPDVLEFKKETKVGKSVAVKVMAHEA